MSRHLFCVSNRHQWDFLTKTSSNPNFTDAQTQHRSHDGECLHILINMLLLLQVSSRRRTLKFDRTAVSGKTGVNSHDLSVFREEVCCCQIKHADTCCHESHTEMLTLLFINYLLMWFFCRMPSFFLGLIGSLACFHPLLSLRSAKVESWFFFTFKVVNSSRYFSFTTVMHHLFICLALNSGLQTQD